MAVDYSKFDRMVNLDELQKEVKNAKDNNTYEDVPDGEYTVTITKMDIRETKAGDKLMFAVECKIMEGKYYNRKLFFNRVISGNRNTEKWNDGVAIQSVCTWVNHLLDESDEPVEFVNYADFADQILDVYQEVCSQIELDITWKADAFNPITIKEVYDT